MKKASTIDIESFNGTAQKGKAATVVGFCYYRQSFLLHPSGRATTSRGRAPPASAVRGRQRCSGLHFPATSTVRDATICISFCYNHTGFLLQRIAGVDFLPQPRSLFGPTRNLFCYHAPRASFFCYNRRCHLLLRTTGGREKAMTGEFIF